MSNTTEKCLFVGGPFDGEWLSTDIGNESVALDYLNSDMLIAPIGISPDPINKARALSRHTYVRATLQEQAEGNRKIMHNIYIHQCIKAHRVISALLNGYRKPKE